MSSALFRKIWRRYLHPIRSYWHFFISHNLKIQDGGNRHLVFSGYVNLTIPACWQCGIWALYLFEIQDGVSDYVNLTIRVCWQCGICALYQIGLKYLHCYLRSTHLCFRRWFDDVTRINFCFDCWSGDHLRMAVMHLSVKFGADIFIQRGVIDILPKLKITTAAILDLLGSHGTTHEGTLMVRAPCKNFVMIGSVGFKL